MNEIETLKSLFQRAGCCCLEEDSLSDSEAKLVQILRESSLDDVQSRKECIESINAFMVADDIQKRKILSYCLDFIDPTIALKQPNASDEQTKQHKFLEEDEIVSLYKFVKRHSADKSFGEIVYKVIDEHGMTPPEVYKNALLRRQDFSRVTDPKAKNVTRQIAWQIIIGLHCSLDEADEVLFSAGFIRRNSRLDLTMEFFIRQKNYDIMAINEVLDELGIKPFSCYKPVKDKDNK